MSSLGNSSVLEYIVGADMSSVIFIRDYIQLVFEGDTDTYTLTAFTLPTVTVDNKVYNINIPCYRDVLCSLIGKQVIRTEVQEKVAIRVLFESKDLVQISLFEKDYEGQPEVAMFCNYNGSELEVW